MRARILSVLVTLGVLGAVGFAAVSARRLGPQPPPTGPLADALAGRVVKLMETTFRGVLLPEAARCAARPFGVRPERLSRASQATTIYAWVHCRGLETGRAVQVPVAVRLDGEPSLRVPEKGAGDERSLRRVFPADVRDNLRAARFTDPAGGA